MMREMARIRSSMRARDISESKHLLWELVTHEPTVLQCFNIVESTCLSQGLFCKIGGERCGEGFQKFLNRHYVPFCRQAVRAMFTYGFVPWGIRQLESGDRIPEILCNGTFHWFTEVPSRDAKAINQQKTRGHVAYRVQITSALDVKDEDIEIYAYTPPSLDVSVNSMLYATVPSPLSHVLIDYKNLRQAQIRRSHADAWNTTAKLICSFKPTVRVQEDPSSSLMDFADESYFQPAMHLGLPAFAPVGATNLWSRDRQIRQQFEVPGATHTPDVFTLPRDHDVAQQPMLVPCEDMEFLLGKFQRDVAAVMGIPEEMVRSQVGGGGAGKETAKKTMATGRIFSANMCEMCRHLQTLLAMAYERIYKSNAADFILLPMPRLEVESIEDMKTLFEIGAITPDMSLQLSQIMLGEDIDNKRRRVQLEQEAKKRIQNGEQDSDEEANDKRGGAFRSKKDASDSEDDDDEDDDEDEKDKKKKDDKPKRTKPTILKGDEVESMKGKKDDKKKKKKPPAK